MRRLSVLLGLAILVVLPLSPEGFTKSGNLAVEEFTFIPVNGTTQGLLIRAADASKPVLLYIHGGPGQSLVPWAHVATKDLVKDFIVVYWDQRGAGLSYDNKIPKETMSIGHFIEDARSVTAYLKKRFDKQKILLLGHSWGSNLGLRVVQKCPADYYAYIGVGQVVHSRQQAWLGVEWLKRRLLEAGTEDEKSLIPGMEQDNFANRALLSKYGGHVHNISGPAFLRIMKTSPYFPEKYTNELFEKGVVFSMFLREEIRRTNFFIQIPRVEVPTFFFLGRWDYVTPTEPVVEYFQDLEAPRKEIVWFEKSGHRMDVEEPVKFQKEIVRLGALIGMK